MHTMRKLFEHMEWADARVRASLEADPNCADAVRLYAHVLGAELVWIDRIEHKPQTVAVWPDVDLNACVEMATEARARYRALLASLSPESLAQTVRYKTTAGVPYETPVEDILLQVALHGSYHRGQIARALREHGADPAVTDYIVYARP